MERIKKYKKYILEVIICLGLLLLFIPRSSNSDQLVVKGDKSKIEKTEKQKEELNYILINYSENLRIAYRENEEMLKIIQMENKKEAIEKLNT